MLERCFSGSGYGKIDSQLKTASVEDNQRKKWKHEKKKKKDYVFLVERKMLYTL